MNSGRSLGILVRGGGFDRKGFMIWLLLGLLSIAGCGAKREVVGPYRVTAINFRPDKAANEAEHAYYWVYLQGAPEAFAIIGEDHRPSYKAGDCVNLLFDPRTGKGETEKTKCN